MVHPQGKKLCTGEDTLHGGRPRVYPVPFSMLYKKMKVMDCSFFTKHAHACGVVKDRVFFLMMLRVDEDRRESGWGIALLRALACWCVQRGIRRVDVDDMTDRHRQAHNIYVRAGFSYCADVGPEMYASPKQIIAMTAHISRDEGALLSNCSIRKN